MYTQILMCHLEQIYKPTLPELLDLKVPAGVSDKYEEFGIILLKDEDGKKMAVIENEERPKKFLYKS